MSRMTSAPDTATAGAGGASGGFYVFVEQPGDLAVGDRFLDDDEFVVADPRTAPVGDIITANLMVADLVLGRAPATMFTLAPCGATSAAGDYFHHCDQGWTITGRAPVSALLGPQADHLIKAITAADRELVDNPYGPIAVAYAKAIDAQHDHDIRIVDAAEAAAAQALDTANVSGWWWTCGFSCVYGSEMLALAARDLIGTVPGWDQAAYDLLTTPWRAAFGTPLHPGDATPDDTTPKTCDNTSVAVIIHDDNGRVLVFERATFPPGVTVPAGHIDDHGSQWGAAAAEVAEETGLQVLSLTHAGGGWRPNRCRRLPGAAGVGHHWQVFTAEACGELALAEREARNARWASPGLLQQLADRTAAYAHGKLTDDEFTAEPGLEPVQVQWLVDAELVDAGPEDLAVIDQLAYHGTVAAR